MPHASYYNNHGLHHHHHQQQQHEIDAAEALLDMPKFVDLRGFRPLRPRMREWVQKVNARMGALKDAGNLVELQRFLVTMRTAVAQLQAVYDNEAGRMIPSETELFGYMTQAKVGTHRLTH